MKKNKATRKPVLSIFWVENRLHSYYKTYLKGGKKRSAETRFKFRITIATERREGKITRLLFQIIKSLKE